MKKFVLVTAIAAASLGLGACSKSQDANTATASEVTLNDEVAVDDNLSAVDGGALGNNSADAALPADNADLAANSATTNGF